MKICREKSTAANGQVDALVACGQVVKVENGWIISPDIDSVLNREVLSGFTHWQSFDKNEVQKRKRQAREYVKKVDRAFLKLQKFISDLDDKKAHLLLMELKRLEAVQKSVIGKLQTMMKNIDTSSTAISTAAKPERESHLMDQMVLACSFSFKSKKNALKFAEHGPVTGTCYALEYHAKKLRVRSERDVVKFLNPIIRSKMKKYPKCREGVGMELKARIRSYSTYATIAKRIRDSYRRVKRVINVP